MSENPPPVTPRPRPGYDLEIKSLKARAVEMGEFAAAMVHDGWRAFDAGDLAAAQRVLDRGDELDRLDEDMEHAAIAFLVLRQPTAIDLRTAAALLKITTHLDRIGRLGFDMARKTTAESSGEPEDVHRLLTEMDETVESMVGQSLEALAGDGIALARSLFRRDDEVDSLHRKVTRRLVDELKRSSSATQRLANELLIARHFERIADNACKIAEKTIYALTAQRRSEYLPRHQVVPYALETPAKEGRSPK